MKSWKLVHALALVYCLTGVVPAAAGRVQGGVHLGVYLPLNGSRQIVHEAAGEGRQRQNNGVDEMVSVTDLVGFIYLFIEGL